MVLPMPRGPTTSKCRFEETAAAFSFRTSKISSRHLCRTTKDLTSSLSPRIPGLYLKGAVAILLPPLRCRHVGKTETRFPPVFEKGRSKRIHALSAPEIAVVLKNSQDVAKGRSPRLAAMA